MLMHGAKRTFTCTVCSKQFSHPQTLKRHSRIHTRDRPTSTLIKSETEDGSGGGGGGGGEIKFSEHTSLNTHILVSDRRGGKGDCDMFDETPEGSLEGEDGEGEEGEEEDWIDSELREFNKNEEEQEVEEEEDQMGEEEQMGEGEEEEEHLGEEGEGSDEDDENDTSLSVQDGGSFDHIVGRKDGELCAQERLHLSNKTLNNGCTDRDLYQRSACDVVPTDNVIHDVRAEVEYRSTGFNVHRGPQGSDRSDCDAWSRQRPVQLDYAGFSSNPSEGPEDRSLRAARTVPQDP